MGIWSTRHECHERCAIDDDLAIAEVSVSDELMFSDPDSLAAICAGVQLEAAAFLTRSQTESVSARSLVQDSGAPARLSTAPRDV